MPPPRKPIDRFSWDLLRILRDSLTQPRLNRDVFDTRAVATLSHSYYVRHLLSRDYRENNQQWVATLADGSQVKFHDEATRYFYSHMAYRLALAPKPADLPGERHVTNMHRLFLHLARHGTSPRWRDAHIQRSPRCPATHFDPSALEPVSQALSRLCEASRLEELGELTAGRRRDSGPIWLVVEGAAAQMPEQMSLFDVVHTLPLPLEDGLAGDREVQKYLTRVLDSVNERYALVRACGLALEPWLERNHPSIGALKQLRALRRASARIISHGICTRPMAAHRQAFLELKGTRRKFAGVKTVEELMRTEYGAEMLGQDPLSLDTLCELAGETALEADLLADDSVEMRIVAREGDLVQWLEDAVRARPRLFSPLMRALFRAVLLEQRGIDELVADSTFRKLVDSDPVYAGLSVTALEAALRREALEVIKSAKSSTLRAVHPAATE